jgi:hypothetical protein
MIPAYDDAHESRVLVAIRSIEDIYREAKQVPDLAAMIHVARLIHDYYAGMKWDVAAAKRYHELRVQLGLIDPPVPVPPPVPVVGRTGLVYMANHCMVDDQGATNWIGSSYFPLLWMVKNEYSRCRENLMWMSQRGVQFVRAFCEVGGPTWADRVIDPRDPEWLSQFRHSLILAKECGLRVEPTLFAGGVLTKEREWSDATDKFIDAARPMLDVIQFPEARNEENGPGVTQARELAGRIRMQLGCPVAICGSPENMLGEIYKDSRATIATLHVSREAGERGYRVVRQIKHEIPNLPPGLVNNEGKGIRSSDDKNDEGDPMLFAAAAITTWICNGCAFVFHTGAGIRAGGAADIAIGRVANVWEQPTMEESLRLMVEAKKRLPHDVANWTRYTHGHEKHPLRFLTKVGDDVEAGADGCNRAYAAVAADGRWVCFIAGIRNKVGFTSSTPFEAWSLKNGDVRRDGPGEDNFDPEKGWGPCVLLSSV